jgi:hypothetical protein
MTLSHVPRRRLGPSTGTPGEGSSAGPMLHLHITSHKRVRVRGW